MSLPQVQTRDVVNAILGVDDTSDLAKLRNQKPVLAEQLQDYYRAIFEPEERSAASIPVLDRFLVALRVASHTRSTAVVAWYVDLARQSGATEETVVRVRDADAFWEDASPLGAALRHADLLTLHPVDARKSALDVLNEVGFTPAGIVSLSQTIAYVSYQVRLVAGLRAIGGLA